MTTELWVDPGVVGFLVLAPLPALVTATAE